MSNPISNSEKTSPKYKKWLINIAILIIVTIVMLAMVEGAMRWIDGYRLSTIELDQDNNTLPPTE